MDYLIPALQGGAASLAAYLAAHVLLCLVPAFFIAGALSALVPQAAITRYLGPDAPRWVAYPAAAGAGSLLAVCSCTVQPLFAGIYSKGAGLGPAITFLFFAPAANILALSYTGVALGAEIAIARIVLALSFGIGIGMIMAMIFRRSEAARQGDARAFAGDGRVPATHPAVPRHAGGAADCRHAEGGHADRDALAAQHRVAGGGAARRRLLDRWVPTNEATGAEGISLQGVALIALLGLIGAAAWRGLGLIDNGVNRLTVPALALTVLTLAFAALGLRVTDAGIDVTVSGRTLAVPLLCAALLPQVRRFEDWDMQQWLWETWRFVKMIFPLLVVGVFLIGVIRVFIQPEWIKLVAGSNTVAANLAGVVFGVFMYFPTLVEVPIAKMFLSLGMHPGPLIAYLMADPELSLQSILITSAIIGKLKAWTYVGLVALFSTLAGLAYGAWVDGTPALTLVLIVGGFVATLVVALNLIENRRTPC
jgi:uncharacterized membrane protein YraQ (UPF0718 family)